MTEQAYVYHKKLDETFYIVANDAGDFWIYNGRDVDVTDEMADWYFTLNMIPWEPFGPDEDYYRDLLEDR